LSFGISPDDQFPIAAWWCHLRRNRSCGIAWALASGISAARLARMIGCHRNTVANRQAAALRIIAGHLNRGETCVQHMDECSRGREQPPA